MRNHLQTNFEMTIYKDKLLNAQNKNPIFSGKSFKFGHGTCGTHVIHWQ